MWWIEIVCFLVTLLVFCCVKKIVSNFVIKMVSNYRLSQMMDQVSRVSSLGSASSYEEKEEKEGIGLGDGNYNVGSSIIFTFLAKKNKGLIEEMQLLLVKAGMRNKDAMEKFVKTKINCCVALFFIVFFYACTNDLGIPIEASFLGAIVIGIIGGHRLSNMNLEMIAKKRMESIEHGIPDLVDLLVICTESGLDLNRSIVRIARELRTSNPILADELSLTAIELEMIPDHRQVFANLEERLDCLEIKTISKTLSQSIEYGSSLAVSLRDLAVESRQKRMLNAEAKAAQAPTLLTLPMMFFIMPCLFIVMLGPVIVGMIRSFGSSGV